ncbi:2-dehydro-3-deoxy-6-phosphogalactonate aldolase [Promicromonospora iranensis]|uniref:2-dehydro-3-deoxyphosphogalactonate aldolase n=1 Tax=Promicromonospora iranensis TaxID=1105144 RepID=A0ABU2CMD8_9MICO|nr:2-dehydro-3-deoxy-6-phosphogalactonate aldolase [Promicromonospora iranensis]MDR7382483.1 2-dehydro-3-deoxyphosphogalactonate aldolase [Promicromonospora iranensis]
MTNRPTGLVAILRGVTPDEAVAVAEAVLDAGFDAVEVPYNSPDPLESIRRIRAAGPPDRRVGAGTVLTPDDVRRAADAGASLIVSPHTRADVVAETVRLGLASYPGAATPTEAFAALDAGARAVKLFPSTTIGIDGMRAWASVLPPGTELVPVGGVDATNLAAWAAAGASGAGVGTSLYRPGDAPETVGVRAAELVRIWHDS